jgi:hypothetical protein
MKIWFCPILSSKTTYCFSYLHLNLYMFKTFKTKCTVLCILHGLCFNTLHYSQIIARWNNFAITTCHFWFYGVVTLCHSNFAINYQTDLLSDICYSFDIYGNSTQKVYISTKIKVNIFVYSSSLVTARCYHGFMSSLFTLSIGMISILTLKTVLKRKLSAQELFSFGAYLDNPRKNILYS